MFIISMCIFRLKSRKNFIIVSWFVDFMCYIFFFCFVKLLFVVINYTDIDQNMLCFNAMELNVCFLVTFLWQLFPMTLWFMQFLLDTHIASRQDQISELLCYTKIAFTVITSYSQSLVIPPDTSPYRVGSCPVLLLPLSCSILLLLIWHLHLQWVLY